MIPLKDDNPTRTTPWVTLVLIAVNVGVYFLLQPGGQATFHQTDVGHAQVEELRFHLENAAIPEEITSGEPLTDAEVSETFPARGGPSSVVLCPPDDDERCYPDKGIWRSVLYSMFLHGSIMHLLGNMLFLWIFGNNIEDKRGRPTYVVFYLLAGVAATIAQVFVDTGSTIPMIGASGAVAGVMGAYLVLYPNVRIHTLLVLGFFILFRDIRAKWLLAFWFAGQFFIAPDAGVAYMAHVGGFVFGALAGLVWRAMSPPPRRERPAWSPTY